MKRLLLSSLALVVSTGFTFAADHVGSFESVRDENTGNRVKLTLKDNGDGTFSPRFYVGNLTIGTALPAGTAIIGKVGIDQTTDGTTNNVYARDAGAAWTASRGVSGARFTSADQSGAVASVTDAPTSGQKLVITDVEISVDTAMRVDLKEETSGTVISSVYMAANSTVNLVTRSKRKLATANKKLQVQTSAAGNISVNAFYYSEL